MGQGKDDMEVGHGQKLCAARLNPALFGQSLALRAVPVTAGVEAQHLCPAGVALL